MKRAIYLVALFAMLFLLSFIPQQSHANLIPYIQFVELVDLDDGSIPLTITDLDAFRMPVDAGIPYPVSNQLGGTIYDFHFSWPGATAAIPDVGGDGGPFFGRVEPVVVQTNNPGPNVIGLDFYKDGLPGIPDGTVFGILTGNWDFGVTELVAQPSVPEPATILLLAAGLVGFAGLRRKFKK